MQFLDTMTGFSSRRQQIRFCSQPWPVPTMVVPRPKPLFIWFATSSPALLLPLLTVVVLMTALVSNKMAVCRLFGGLRYGSNPCRDDRRSPCCAESPS